MLLHEWLQYRDKRIKKLKAQADAEEEVAEAERQAEAEQMAEQPQAAPVPPVVPEPQEYEELQQSEEPGEQSAAPAAAAPEPPKPQRRKKTSKPKRPAQTHAPSARSARELLEALQPTEDMRARLQAVLAKQRRLPLEEVEDAEGQRPRKSRAAQTREELVARLLDPTLTLQETALLLGVCPTTVRRYTNRGILRCFRTPGNQRRFKLSDVLEFMERRERGEY